MACWFYNFVCINVIFIKFDCSKLQKNKTQIVIYGTIKMSYILLCLVKSCIFFLILLFYKRYKLITLDIL
jgi:hypothetical protein